MLQLRKRVFATLSVFAILTVTAVMPTLADADEVASKNEVIAADNAAKFLVSSIIGSDHLDSSFGPESTTADALIGLVAHGGYTKEVKSLASYLEKQTKSYANTPETALKCAIAAITLRADPADFGGVNLIELVQKGINDDGSFGESPMPFSTGLAMVVLKRAGVEIPQKTADWMLSTQEKSGGWSYTRGSAADPDNTALAVMGLLPLEVEAVSAKQQLNPSIKAAVDWAVKAQNAEGFWEGFSPTSSTAILGMALRAVQTDKAQKAADKAAAGLAETVLVNNGGFPSTIGDSLGDLLTSSQALLFLTKQNYLFVSSSTNQLTGSDEISATLSPCANGVLVVVDPGDLGGEPKAVCVIGHSTGLEALEAAYSVEKKNTMICRIIELPEKCVTSPTAYWSYWHSKLDADGKYTKWEYSSKGAHIYPVEPGVIEGWIFGDGKAAPSWSPEEALNHTSFSDISTKTPKVSTPSESNPGFDTGTIVLAAVEIAAIAGIIVFLLIRMHRKSSRSTSWSNESSAETNKS